MANGRLRTIGGVACALCLAGTTALLLPACQQEQAETLELVPNAAADILDDSTRDSWAYTGILTTASDSGSSANSASASDPGNSGAQLATHWQTSTAVPRGIVSLLSSADTEDATDEAETATAEEEVDVSDEMTGEALKGIPAESSLGTFSLAGSESAPSLKGEYKRAIRQSVQDLAEAGYGCGFVFLDLASGNGIAFNAGELFYSASAFKAPFCLYVLENEEAGLADYDRSNIEGAILVSSNSAYDALAGARMGQAYNDWLNSHDIQFDASMPYYANVSAKSMARIWADLYQYLQTGTKDAEWFAGLLSQTSRSFIRSNLKGEDVTVYNKAGWIGDSDYCATTDCAYIAEDGHPYLMVVLTDQPDADASNHRAGAIAKALFDARDLL